MADEFAKTDRDRPSDPNFLQAPRMPVNLAMSDGKNLPVGEISSNAEQDQFEFEEIVLDGIPPIIH